MAMSAVRKTDFHVENESAPLSAEISERRDSPGAWGVEAFDADGACLMAVFSGPLAKERAVEYANAKYSGGRGA